MADFSELQVQVTLTIGELRDLVALSNLAGEALSEGQVPGIVEEISSMYFQIMENLTTDGFLGEFQPG